MPVHLTLQIKGSGKMKTAKCENCGRQLACPLGCEPEDESVESACSADFVSRDDDGEPLTDQWFIGKWPEEHRDDTYAIECNVGWLEVTLYGDECRDWMLGGNHWDGVNFRTRGDVRRFLWYLEAELIP